MFDTLKYAKRLEAAGMTREQAEAQIHIIAEMVVDGVATKQDLKILRQEMKFDTDALRAELSEFKLETRAEFAAVRNEMQLGFVSLENRLILRLGLLIAASTTMTITVLTFVR